MLFFKQHVVAAFVQVVLVALFALIIDVEPKITHYFTKTFAGNAPKGTSGNIRNAQNEVHKSTGVAANTSTAVATGASANAAAPAIDTVSLSYTEPSGSQEYTSSYGTGEPPVDDFLSDYTTATPTKKAPVVINKSIATPSSKNATEKAEAAPVKKTAKQQEGDKASKSDFDAKTTASAANVAQKVLGSHEMGNILSQIKTARSRLNKQTNCVKVLKAKGSNISNAFDLAAFLQSNGFTISGREVVNAAYNGVAIDATDECIKVMIGTM